MSTTKTTTDRETLVLLYEDGDVVDACVVVGLAKRPASQLTSVVVTARKWADATGSTANWAAPVRDAKTSDHPDLQRVPIESVNL